ncbi:hypothetical protein PN36_17775 [Candidatus Thiomargarita nelsonii]|uniref:Uncharacterized protein n=1 Tax=Candidatus Thiomargarita nelsonii TaxID=1003181 RepID=A0A4E0QPE4_9GAMM|nr:hypothetical protein PN36_17775 [Candidatus Thiomargarita nelsonii]
MVKFGGEVMKTAECCVAARGTTFRGAPVPPTATGTSRTNGSATSAFGSSVARTLSPLPLSRGGYGGATAPQIYFFLGILGIFPL